MREGPFDMAEKSWILAETFSHRISTEEGVDYESSLEFRNKNFDKPFMVVREDGCIETIKDYGYQETGEIKEGIPVGFETLAWFTSDDLRWIADVIDEFSEREPELKLKRIK